MPKLINVLYQVTKIYNTMYLKLPIIPRLNSLLIHIHVHMDQQIKEIGRPENGGNESSMEKIIVAMYGKAAFTCHTAQHQC